MQYPSSCRAILAATAFALACATPRAQEPSARFHEAYYLECERADYERALELYRAVESDRAAPKALRQKAGARARAVAEEIASSDFARLMPADAIFYLELNRPGQQLESLVSQLGLLGDGSAERLGISPKLIEGLLGLRGAAVAITEFDPRRGPQDGVLIAHPGKLDVVRGLLETALPAGASPVAAIGGHPTFDVEGQALVTLTHKLLVAGRKRATIEQVVARLAGDGGPCLADSESAQGALRMRGDDLAFFCLNVQPLLPMIEGLAQRAARRDPGVMAAMMLLDVRSTQTVAGHLGVDDQGLALELALDLDEGHRNIAFNLLRMSNLSAESLAMVPSGAAFFAAGALNQRGDVPAGNVDGRGRPAVSLMDLGREVFANVAEFALYVMPRVHEAPFGPMPEVALAMHCNDVERSMALWDLVLGSAQAGAGAAQEPQQAGNGVRYEIAGVPIYLGTKGHTLAVSPSEAAVAAALRGGGNGVAQDEAFAGAVRHFGSDSTVAVAAQVGRCMEIARHFMRGRQKQELEQVAGLLQNTSVALRLAQSSHRLGAAARVSGIPDVAPMVEHLVAQHRQRRGGRAVAARSAVRAPARAVVSVSPVEAFELAHGEGEIETARGKLKGLLSSAGEDPQTLNDLAWRLLTEERYGGQYDEIALSLSRTSNEASGWENWFYVDTYARALFENGDIEGAIRYEKKAIELGKDHPRIGEAKSQLEEFLAAAKGRKVGDDN